MARWMEFLAKYEFETAYKQRAWNFTEDFLSLYSKQEDDRDFLLTAEKGSVDLALCWSMFEENRVVCRQV